MMLPYGCNGFASSSSGTTDAVRGLPPIHKDPFDRMLVVQALAEGLTIVTADPVFERYGANVVRADE